MFLFLCCLIYTLWIRIVVLRDNLKIIMSVPYLWNGPIWINIKHMFTALSQHSTRKVLQSEGPAKWRSHLVVQCQKWLQYNCVHSISFNFTKWLCFTNISCFFQSVCEKVFVGYFRKLPTGLLRDPPDAIKVELFNLLQECSNPVEEIERHVAFHIPRPETVTALQELLLRSLDKH